MDTAEFVECCAKEKDSLLRMFLDPSQGTTVAAAIADLNLRPEQASKLEEIVDGILSDTLFTILAALDGGGSLGGRQERYSLRSEDGVELTGGDLEAAAWERFHGQKLARSSVP